MAWNPSYPYPPPPAPSSGQNEYYPDQTQEEEVPYVPPTSIFDAIPRRMSTISSLIPEIEDEESYSNFYPSSPEQTQYVPPAEQSQDSVFFSGGYSTQPRYSNVLPQQFQNQLYNQELEQEYQRRWSVPPLPPSPTDYYPIDPSLQSLPNPLLPPQMMMSPLPPLNISATPSTFDESPSSSSYPTTPTSSQPPNSNTRPQVMPYRAGVTPFVSKLYWILERPEEFGDCICWDSTGELFIVDMAHDKLINEILPSFYNHTSIVSFCRQLQLYNFDRLSTDAVQSALYSTNKQTTPGSDWRAFSHQAGYFKRDDTSELKLMKPRQSKARINKKLQNAEKKAAVQREHDEEGEEGDDERGEGGSGGGKRSNYEPGYFPEETSDEV